MGVTWIDPSAVPMVFCPKCYTASKPSELCLKCYWGFYYEYDKGMGTSVFWTLRRSLRLRYILDSYVQRIVW